MPAEDKENMKKWIEGWRKAATALKEIKRRELRAYDYQENKAVINGMLQWACDHSKARLGSGLVDQQRFFLRMKESPEIVGKLKQFIDKNKEEKE